MNIKIGKSSNTCHICEKEFEHEQEMVSLVRIVEGALEREDYCPACWDDSRAETAYSTWTPRFYDPRVAEQEPPEVFSPLRHLFYEAVETEDRVWMAAAYLAAQLLRRQKVFRLIKETDGQEGESNVALFSDRIGNRLIEVRDPSLSHAEMEEGRQRLIVRLNELERAQEAALAAEQGKDEDSNGSVSPANAPDGEDTPPQTDDDADGNVSEDSSDDEFDEDEFDDDDEGDDDEDEDGEELEDDDEDEFDDDEDEDDDDDEDDE